MNTTSKNNIQSKEIGQAEIEKVVAAVRAIKDGPRVLQLYMDLCAKCGTCAMQCHVSEADPERRTNPARRSDLIRKMFKEDGSVIKKIASAISGKESSLIDKESVEEWARDF